MAARTQYGALCWRMHAARPEVLLITSRDTGRWVIPKGWPMEALSAAAYRKGLGPQKVVPCVVEVFALRVERLASSYPEKGQRRRKWFSPEKAAKRVQEPDLRQLILAFAPEKVKTAAAQPAKD